MGVLQNVIGEIEKIVERLSVSSKEKQKIQEEIQSLAYRYKSELVREQSASVKSEAQGNWLQRSWRPIVMLVFILILVSGRGRRYWPIIPVYGIYWKSGSGGT